MKTTTMTSQQTADLIDLARVGATPTEAAELVGVRYYQAKHFLRHFPTRAIRKGVLQGRTSAPLNEMTRRPLIRELARRGLVHSAQLARFTKHLHTPAHPDMAVQLVTSEYCKAA